MKVASARRALPVLLALGLAGLWGGTLGWSHLEGGLPLLDRLEATMTDLRTLIRGRTEPPESIVIVAIDDETVLREGRYPLSRATIGRIVDEIAGAGAKAIALDLLLLDAGRSEEDEALAAALSRAPAVIAAAAVFPGGRQWLAAEGRGTLGGIPEAERFLLPRPAFSERAPVGVVNVATDRSGAPRFMPLLFRAAGRVEASLPLRVAALAAGADPEIGDDRVVLGQRSIATDLGHFLPLAFYGPRGTVRTVSAESVLAGRLEPGMVSGRIVVIGATVTGGGDVFPSPFDPVLPGVEVVSTAIAHLVEGDGPVRDRKVRLADAGVAVLLPVLLVGLVAWRRSAIGFAAMAGVALAWAALNVAAFSAGIWLSAALPIAAALPPVMLFGAMQLWQNRNRAERFASQSALLQRVQAPGLGKWLATHSDFLAEPVRADAAVVFIDLSGFTGLSETLGPSATRDILNGFHALVDDEVTACGGIVTSYMGDGSMILFGLPEPAKEDAANAARCSIGLCRRTRTWLDGLPAATSTRLGFKVGAHYGAIVASRLGGESHQHIAATGDTVNVASRLMEIAAAHGAELALSDELLKVAGGADLFASGILTGPIEAGVRGRGGSLAVWLWRGPVSEAQLRPEHAP